jgi:YHS domain-containing protein
MEETYGLQDYSEGEPTFSVDPVCGMKVEEGKEAGKTTYAGQTFYFCSTHCQKRFEESPGAHIGQPGAASLEPPGRT